MNKINLKFGGELFVEPYIDMDEQNYEIYDKHKTYFNSFTAENESDYYETIAELEKLDSVERLQDFFYMHTDYSESLSYLCEQVSEDWDESCRQELMDDLEKYKDDLGTILFDYDIIDTGVHYIWGDF